MSTLGREELFEACRAIYRTAGDNFMLPPLIRDVESPEEHPKHTYYSLTEAECIRFIIELDEAYVGGNKFPLKKFPLRFRCELCDLDFQEPPIELGEIETRALIRAFFLGVKVQINASENRHANKYNLRIQLSSTLFVECGELIDEDDELTPEGICNQVSLDLYSKSSDFFGSPQDGITVWRVRVAQELFGELKPAPEVFWPPEAEMARRAMMRDAISAMTLAVANANQPALATSPLRASAPILVDAPTNLARVRREFFASGIAASLIIGVTGLTAGYAFWGAISASPRTPTISARTARRGSRRKGSGLSRSSWPRLGSRRAKAHNAGPFWRCKRSFRAASSGGPPGRRDASRDRRDEPAFPRGRGDAGGAGGILHRRSQAGETK